MTKNLDRFKFRYWNRNGNEMIAVNFIHCENCLYSYANSCVLNDRYVMQCTGLKDKSGNLIYEGDIVSIEGETCTIEWSEDNAGFVARCRTPNHLDYDIYGFCDVEMEILGNIYENPVL